MRAIVHAKDSRDKTVKNLSVLLIIDYRKKTKDTHRQAAEIFLVSKSGVDEVQQLFWVSFHVSHFQYAA